MPAVINFLVHEDFPPKSGSNKKAKQTVDTAADNQVRIFYNIQMFMHLLTQKHTYICKVVDVVYTMQDSGSASRE